MLHSYENEQTATTGSSMDESYKQNVEWKLSDTKDHILFDHSYIKFNNANLTYDNKQCLGLEGRGIMNGKKNEGDFLSLNNVLFLGLGDSYTGLFILWKFIELYACDLCTF